MNHRPACNIRCNTKRTGIKSSIPVNICFKPDQQNSLLYFTLLVSYSAKKIKIGFSFPWTNSWICHWCPLKLSSESVFSSLFSLILSPTNISIRKISLLWAFNEDFKVQFMQHCHYYITVTVSIVTSNWNWTCQ